MVERGELTLDDDVNAKLKSWKVPENEFTQKEKVTLRRLLSHTAGLTVHGFPGYDINERMPSVVQVLDGAGNTAAVRVNVVPGSISRYSGGGYTVMQQLVSDVTGKSFPEYVSEAVLAPLGMSSSTYRQPIPHDRAPETASGHYADRSVVPGKWHVYPEMAAAGLKGGGEVVGLTWSQNGQERPVPRIGPLFASIKEVSDPAPSFTQTVAAAVRALAQGGEAMRHAPQLAPGARTDLSDAPVRDLAGVRQIKYLSKQDVTGRKIERHGGAVTKVIFYRLETERGTRWLLVHVTGDNLITDYDVVDK